MTVARRLFIKNSALVYTGSLVNAGLTFLASILLARLVGPADFGLFATAFAVLYLASELTDLGINPSVVRYAAQYLQEGKTEQAKVVFRFALRSRLILTSILALGGWVFAPFISSFIFKLPELTELLRIAFLGIIPLFLTSYLVSIFQSQQRFGPPVGIGLISGLVKIVAVVALFSLGELRATTALISFALAPFVALLYALTVTDRTLLKKVVAQPEIIREIRSFSIWMGLWALFAILHGKLDQFMVTGILGAAAAGLYAAAYQLASLVILLVGAIGTVLNPRVAAMKQLELLNLWRKAPLFSLLLAGVIAVLIAAGNGALPLLFGDQFTDALPTYNVIMVGLFFFGSAVLPNAILSALKKPFIFSLSAAGGLAITFVLNLYFIPAYGVVGAAFTFLLVNLLSLALSSFATIRYLRPSHESA
jgi:O-antigen/teichoic acid export membrane protein